MPHNQCPHVYISTHFYEMFQQSEFLFGENHNAIEYLTFDYLFDEDIEADIHKKRLIFLYKLRNGLTK